MLRIGVIGFGVQGKLYSGILSGTAQGKWPVLPKPAHCVLTAVSSGNAENRAAIEAIPNVQYFKDWRELLASDACDAVVITVPHLSPGQITQRKEIFLPPLQIHHRQITGGHHPAHLMILSFADCHKALLCPQRLQFCRQALRSIL